MTPDIRLHETCDTILWPETLQDSSERVWLEAFLKNGVAHYIRNITTRFYILQLDQWFFPLTVNDTNYNNAYTCSPYTHYISYAKQELRHLKTPFLEKSLDVLLSMLGLCLKSCKINKTVQVNNWLLSTNLYPDWQGDYLPLLTNWLIRNFPSHAIFFRSLNSRTEQVKLQKFQDTDYQLLLSRQVYFVDGKESDFLRKKDVKQDKALADKSSYTLVQQEQVTDDDILRIERLYAELYLDKYSNYNPEFTAAFFNLCLKNRLLKITGLRQSGKPLDGVIGYFARNGVMTTPLVGYNRSIPQKEGLYRLLTLQVLQEATAREMLFNMSSGAANFKRSRGASAALEYSAVFTQHLSPVRRLPWYLLYCLTTQIAKPLMQKFKL